MRKLRILFLAANPTGTSPLALDEEIRAITQQIQLSAGRDRLDVISAWAVRPDDLLQHLNQHRPHIVHFSGHGSSAGEIVLVNDRRQPMPVSAAALTALFTTLKDNIQIVVLNACYSRVQAEAIAKVIDYVVGMNTAIGDDAARIFAAAFYRALGFDRTIREAFDQGRTALLLEGIPEDRTPELIAKAGTSKSANVFRLGNRQQSAPLSGDAQQAADAFAGNTSTLSAENKFLREKLDGISKSLSPKQDGIYERALGNNMSEYIKFEDSYAYTIKLNSNMSFDELLESWKNSRDISIYDYEFKNNESMITYEVNMGGEWWREFEIVKVYGEFMELDPRGQGSSAKRYKFRPSWSDSV